MNVFEKAKAAADNINIKAFPDVYTEGDEDTWITYNLAYEQGELFGDDAARDMRSGIQIHLFLPAETNFFSIRKSLRDALIDQGFTHPDMVLNTVEGKTRHIVMECEDDYNENYNEDIKESEE